MNPNLHNRIELMRSAVNMAIAAGPFLGGLPKGRKPPVDCPPDRDYRAFISLSDGALCGEAVFHSVDSLGGFRWMADELRSIPGNWHVIGGFDRWTMALDSDTGRFLLVQLPLDSESIHRDYDRLDPFLMDILSSEYVELNEGCEDDWSRMLGQTGLAEK